MRQQNTSKIQATQVIQRKEKLVIIVAIKGTTHMRAGFERTIHVCNNKNHFKDYDVAEDEQEVLMGNYNTIKMMRK